MTAHENWRANSHKIILSRIIWHICNSQDRMAHICQKIALPLFRKWLVIWSQPMLVLCQLKPQEVSKSNLYSNTTPFSQGNKFDNDVLQMSSFCIILQTTVWLRRLRAPRYCFNTPTWLYRSRVFYAKHCMWGLRIFIFSNICQCANRFTCLMCGNVKICIYWFDICNPMWPAMAWGMNISRYKKSTLFLRRIRQCKRMRITKSRKSINKICEYIKHTRYCIYQCNLTS